jgi:hypothetical protein
LPYVPSGQVKGLITGVVGAYTYASEAKLVDSTQPQSVQDQIHLEAQVLGHWVLVVVILIGLIYALVSRGRRRSSIS